MDFFKSCTTNVQHIDDIGRTPLTTYVVNTDAKTENAQHIVSKLRQQGVLCTPVEESVWVFGILDDSSSALLRDLDIDLHERGTLESSAKTSTASDILLGAIDRSISCNIMQVANTIPLGSTTWMACTSASSEDDFEDTGRPVLLQLRVQMMDERSLSIATDVTISDLRRICNSGEQSLATSIILAPVGCRAQFHHNTIASTQFGGEQWRSAVTNRLTEHGIDISAADEWVVVRAVCDSPSIPLLWPAKLCLARYGIDENMIESYNWQHFFASTEETHVFADPLRAAEDWFTAAAKRDQMTAASMANKSANMAVSTTLNLTGTPITSPPFLQRMAENQAIASGIYPTPPDGLVPGSAPSHQPSSDVFAADHAMGDSTIAAQDSGLVTEQSPVQPRNYSSPDPTTTFHLEDSANDLFGDMDEEIGFGRDEIGDADFDFFNEDDRPTSGSMNVVLDDQDVDIDRITDDTAEQFDQQAPATFTLDMPAVALELTAEAQPRQNDLPVVSDNTMFVRPSDNGSEDVEHAAQAADVYLVKPLSPFAIKECLLPPPIPASANVGNSKDPERRSSVFDCIAFKDNLSIGSRFSRMYGPGMEAEGSEGENAPQKIDLATAKASKRGASHVSRTLSVSDESSASADDSGSPATSTSDVDLPPRAPWLSKKRKRIDSETNQVDVEVQRILDMDTNDGLEDSEVAAKTMKDVLDRMASCRFSDVYRREDDLVVVDREQLSQPEELLRMSKQDLVYVAQLVAEQAVSGVPMIVQTIYTFSPASIDASARATAFKTLINQSLVQIMPNTARKDITSLALSREPMIRNPPTPVPARPGQPRPPQRVDNTNLGPDIIAIPAPYVRVQRGIDKYEMLPPALQFWDTLSLAPVNGPKNIQGFCVFPENEDLRYSLDGFLCALRASYEERKLGSHMHKRVVDECNQADEYENGMAPVRFVDPEDRSLDSALRAYVNTCETLAVFLASIAHLDPDRTIVIYVIDPFRHQDVLQHLCACFWILYQKYRDSLSKNARNQPVSDIVLQVLPIDLIASADSLVTLEAKHFAAVAHEIYDRCPPSQSCQDSNASSALPDYVAPSFELASPPPKRIGFQLTAEPPGDLLHEASALHLAYAISRDGLWLTAAWVDSTGRYQSSTSYAICGQTIADVVKEVWEYTMAVLSARQVGWRVFIITPSRVDDSIKQCWRELVERPRKQAFSVTLLTADLDPVLKLSPPLPPAIDESAMGPTSGAGFLTPGSTPQAANLTASPDPSGSATQPPTPALSEALPGGETDPDSHLVDLTDETWAVLFSPSTSQAVHAPSLVTQLPLATGALYKRGEAATPNLLCNARGSDSLCQTYLPSLGVALSWTIQVRPSGTIDEGNVRQAEMTLREVLRMYRNLSVLSRVRGLVGGSGGGVYGGKEALSTCVPVHLVTAVKGAEALDRFIDVASD
ncbi:hypothetical protein LTR62_003608 [Meristemomyces frigidus]|uniref:Mediator of RNA polymerase II transcription subunit 13 n=1 Tax=Meristemomyces frigidus TaxID=1508187 RepID=A0AAN7TKW6_9PEZI|nr:hypothetical protein LTR62_003608 [Meristemomyces frigidus]